MSQFSAKTASGVEDMVLLSKVSEEAIEENLQKRLMDDRIYTYIGPVLIAVNPFKQMPYFDAKTVELYQGMPQHENPPHVYGLTDNAYRNMLIERENQCVIISGESGAGKTVTAKYIMSYIAQVSGGGAAADHVKDVILDSNPLLEAFGNAKTVRNNNSSRFGKYFEIQFSHGGVPDGGKISNFLLEKSRVVGRNVDERSFHIFYQLLAGTSPQQKEALGLTSPDYFLYLRSSGCYTVDGTDDAAEFKDTMHSMGTMGIDEATQQTILQTVAALLHLGNVAFVEQAANTSAVQNPDTIGYPAYLLGVREELLGEKITSREMTTGGRRGSIYTVPLNPEQAAYTRDALVKAIYSRLFDWLVQAVNQAMEKKREELSIGVLDIYGFEIFNKNGFEQFCINFVNEKLQQIFIELTLKAEQEEYVREGIKWTPVDYFNNKVVCDLIEEKRPPGVMAVLDDVCATLHAQGDGADDKFMQKLHASVSDNKYFNGGNAAFTITHYAGPVTYDADGFCERNRDVLYRDLILLMQSSTIPFLQNLFQDDTSLDDRKRPTTAGNKIKTQANVLVATLMKCQPHYIRCIKPNETKKPKDWDKDRCLHQVRYLGLKENVRVRRAGFAYRQDFEKFLRRYSILTEETWPKWTGSPKDGCTHLMKKVNMENGEWQLGTSKIFIKSPESLFLLEELRERKYSHWAKIIQRAWRKYASRRYYIELKKKASDVVYGQKERRYGTLNRNYQGDYISVRDNPAVMQFVGKKEQIWFACQVTKYDRKFKAVKRDLALTDSKLYLVGRDKETKGPNKGKVVPVLVAGIPLETIQTVSVSTFQDDFIVLLVPNEFGIVIETVYKTELLSLLAVKYEKVTGKKINLVFQNKVSYPVKKTLLDRKGERTITWQSGPTAFPAFKTSGKGAVRSVAAGLPKDSRPTRVQEISDIRPARAASGSRAPVQRAPSNTSTGPTPPRASAPNSVGGPVRGPSFGPPRGGAAGLRPRGAAPARGAAPQVDSFTRAEEQEQPRPSQPPVTRANTGAAPRAGGMPPRVGGMPPRATGAGAPRGGVRPSDDRDTVYLQKPMQGAAPAGSNSAAPTAAAVPVIAPKPRPPVPPKPSGPQCRALYDYEAQDTDELTFKYGDVITILKKDNEGWWHGFLNGKQGLFPSNYVEPIN